MDCIKLNKLVNSFISRELSQILENNLIFVNAKSSKIKKNNSVSSKSNKKIDKNDQANKNDFDSRYSEIIAEIDMLKKKSQLLMDSNMQNKINNDISGKRKKRFFKKKDTPKKSEKKLKKDLKKQHKSKASKATAIKDNEVKSENETMDVISGKSGYVKLFKKKKQGKVKKNDEEKVVVSGRRIDTGEIQVIDERTGFGWNGLGSRRIVFDDETKEYYYEISEPILNNFEQECKDNLIKLFKKHTDIDVTEFSFEEKQKSLEDAFIQLIHDYKIKLDDSSRDKVFYFIFRDFLGYGRIDILMTDEGIEDISCDGQGIPIFIFHKNYESIKTNIVYDNADELDSFVVKLAQMCGKQISVYEPIVDGKLYDGSRLQTTLGRTITMRSTFTIRRFREDPLTPVDLVMNNTMSLEMAAFFWLVIEYGVSILFCGGTASGKTTMLNALSLFVPSAYKIVSIEDTREINLPHENWIAGTTRSGFSTLESAKTGRDIDMYDLIRVALRQRPRVIIVGEVRGKEAYTLFQAMTTGHLSYSTVHANNMHSLIQRLENPPIELPRALLTSLDMIVFLNSVTVKGMPVRRITNVTEIIKLDPDTNRLVTMTPFYWLSEGDDRFERSDSSRILYKIKIQNSWDDMKVQEELENRMLILDWMIKNNLRSYGDVGRIVSGYAKDPKEILIKAKGDNK